MSEVLAECRFKCRPSGSTFPRVAGCFKHFEKLILDLFVRLINCKVSKAEFACNPPPPTCNPLPATYHLQPATRGKQVPLAERR